ncbi:hypothetical protein FACS1894166_11500 [Bacilli bacterium]|nr:hypothetical protein FACS1894166_11500 [Bacilli bacterium]
MNNNKQTINNTIPTTLPILNLNNNVLLPFEVLEFEADNSPLVLWTLQKIQKEFNKYFILTYSDDVEGENNNVVSTLALLNSFTIKNEKLYVNLGGVNRVQIKDIHQVRADKFMLSTGEYKHILLDNHFTKAQQETMQKIIHKSTAFEPSVFVTSTYKEIKPLLDANK